MRSGRCTSFSVQGYTDVVDADLSKYFDTIPHGPLMQSVGASDRRPAYAATAQDVAAGTGRGQGAQRAPGLLTGGRKHRLGTPQGGVISPLLANLYMNRFLKHWRSAARIGPTGSVPRWLPMPMTLSILSRGCAAEALEWSRMVMSKLGLALNEDKTSLRNARAESFDFSRIHVRTAFLPEDGPLVSGRKPVTQEACSGSRAR